MRVNFRLGKNMRHALRFYADHPGLHSLNTKEPATVAAMRKLEKLGMVKINEFNQAQITWKGTLTRTQMDAY